MVNNVNLNKNIFLTKKRIIFFTISFLILAGLFIFTLIDILKIDFNILFTDINNQLNTNKISILFLLILLFFPLFRSFQIASIYFIQCKKMNINIKFREFIIVGFIYLLIISITPSSIGGEPYLIYWLNKKGINLKKASAIVLANSTIGHVAGMLVTLPSYIYLMTTYNDFINSINGNLIFWFSTVGMIMDLIVFIWFIIISLSIKIHYWFSLLFNLILKFFKLNHKEKEEINSEIQKQKIFRNYLHEEYKKVWAVIYIFFSTGIYHVLLYVMMFVSLSLVTDFRSINFLDVFNYTNIATTANNFIPLPGSEGSLQILLKAMFGLNTNIKNYHVDEGIFIWRFSSTYFLNIISIFMVFIIGLNFLKLKKYKKYNNQNQKKGILIISNRSHNTIGGIENYNKELINLFQSKNILVKEYTLVQDAYINPNKFISDNILLSKLEFDLNDKSFKKIANFEKIENSNLFKQFFYMKQFIHNSKKIIKKHLLNNSYELIIDSTFFGFNFLFKNDSYVWVQHNSKKSRNGMIYNNLFMNILGFLAIKILGVKNTFKKANNVVLYDSYNEKDINIKNKYFFKIPLFYKNEILKRKIDNKKKIIFIGRLEKHQKRIDLLIKISKYLNEPIEVYGVGPYEEKIKNENNLIYKGKFDNKNIESIFENAKLTLILSNHEGFSFVALESISNSTPILIRDTFPSAKFFTQNKFCGLLVNKKNKATEIAKHINEYLLFIEKNQNEINEKCFEFSIKNFDIQYFKNHWMNLYDDILLKKEITKN